MKQTKKKSRNLKPTVLENRSTANLEPNWTSTATSLPRYRRDLSIIFGVLSPDVSKSQTKECRKARLFRSKAPWGKRTGLVRNKWA